MKRLSCSLSLLLLTAAPAAAHFVFIVPVKGNIGAQVVLAETPAPDPEVDVAIIDGVKLFMRTAQGEDVPLVLGRSAYSYLVSFEEATGPVVHGVLDLGVMTTTGGSEEEAPPNVLRYYPKTILANDPFDANTRLRDAVPVEIVPVGRPRSVQLMLLARGEPLADAEVAVIPPGGEEEIVTTDADGLTPTFTQPGLYSAWARFWEQAPGVRDGVPYEEERHYATLVFQNAQAEGAVSALPKAEPLAARLPVESSSLGVVAADGWLYVYGGHVVRTHLYSTEAVSGRFNRLNLADGTWEELPSGPPVQGMNLAAHDGLIYRVGGMQPANAPGEPQDLRSLDSVGRFDPEAGVWEELPPLPGPLSSHDVVVLDETLIVAGGWDLNGPTSDAAWAEVLYLMDLDADVLEWRTEAQPFTRRAFIATAHDGKMYTFGGLMPSGRITRAVSIYDLADGKWSDGLALPTPEINGFSPAATVLDGTIYVSAANGLLYRLDEAVNGWVEVAETTPRVAHRLVTDGDRVLIVGGAADGANFDLIEAVTVR